MADRRAALPKKPWRMLVVIGGLLLAVNIVIIGGHGQKTNTEGVLPSAIEELIPKPGDLVSPNTEIGVNLRNDLQGILKFDGTEIPLDQLSGTPSEGIILFAPGPEQAMTKLPQGFHKVTVVYWPRGQKQSKGSTSYDWTFKVGA
jgi:hypothetical protein